MITSMNHHRPINRLASHISNTMYRSGYADRMGKLPPQIMDDGDYSDGYSQANCDLLQSRIALRVRTDRRHQ